MLPRRIMKKQNLKGKFGSIDSSPVKRSKPTENVDADMTQLTDEQKQHVIDRYNEITVNNSYLSEHDEQYVTQEALKDELNEFFGVSKSVRSYYRIWNSVNETYL